MSKVDKKEVDNLIHSMALKYNMSDKDMKNLLNSPYEFTKHKINKLNIDEIKTEEDLEKANTNFLYRSFLKLVIELKSIKGRNNRIKNINKVNKNK